MNKLIILNIFFSILILILTSCGKNYLNLTFEATNLINAYETDENRSKKIYEGKDCEITGNISSIMAEPNNPYKIIGVIFSKQTNVRGRSAINPHKISIVCYFRKNVSLPIDNIKVGQQISVKGRIEKIELLDFTPYEPSFSEQKVIKIDTNKPKLKCIIVNNCDLKSLKLSKEYMNLLIRHRMVI